jgi:hypothetical protein
MTQETPLRRLARTLLRFGIRIAPRHAAHWGQAMLGELGQVKGEWAALVWAAGGAGVMVKHALASLVFPRRDAPASLSGEALFAKEGPMRKASLITIAACAALSLSFLLAPAFRQGLGVSLAQWRATFDVTPHSPWPATNPGFRALARRAEQNHDAEAIAFAAVNIFERSERTRLAKEAVQLDPGLTWIYARVWPTPTDFEAWVQKLEQWDPGNALPYFMEAENIDLAQARSRKFIRDVDQQSEPWKNAMAGALRSSKFDDYQRRLVELDRKIAARYGLKDPYEVAAGIGDFSAIPYSDVRRYGEYILESGEKLADRGDLHGALEKYMAVIRFEQAVGAPTPEVLKHAYYNARAVYQKNGEMARAELLSYLADNVTREENERGARSGEWLSAMDLVHWDEAVMKISGLLLPIFGGILLICALIIIARSQSLRLSALRTSPGTLAAGLCSAVGLLLSAAMIYVSYRPFAGIVHEFVRTGDEGGLSQLNEFLDYAQYPLLKPGPNYPLHFWMVVIAICAVTLLAIALRYLHVRPRPKVTT